MTPQCYEIYLTEVKFHDCKDRRPCVIIAVLSSEKVTIAYLSSNKDYYLKSRDLWIDQFHPDFPATGLARSSYIVGDPIKNISISKLVKKLGKLEGMLQKDFESWIG